MHTYIHGDRKAVMSIIFWRPKYVGAVRMYIPKWDYIISLLCTNNGISLLTDESIRTSYRHARTFFGLLRDGGSQMKSLPPQLPLHFPPTGSLEVPETQSSQESNWTSYTNGGSLSAQSSQEEPPEAMMESRGSQDYINSHYLMQLSVVIDRAHQPQQFKCVGIT